MFIGHFAVGFASKRVAPRASLGLLVFAALLIDLLWPVFLLLGLERVRIAPGDTAFTPLAFVSYPISHSLAAVCGWAATLGSAYWLRTRRGLESIVLACVVLSHWFLDVLTHRPDLPIYPGGPLAGLGLWNSPPATILVEAGMFAAGVWLYSTVTSPRGRAGSAAWWALVVFLLAVYWINLAGPPPPNESAVAWVSLLSWLFPVWAFYVDRNRSSTRLVP